MKSSEYIDLFNKADSWCVKNLQLPPAKFPFQNSTKHIDEVSMVKIWEELMSEQFFRENQLKVTGMTCFQSSSYLLPRLPQAIKTSGVLTVGWIKYKDNPLYLFSKDDISSWSNELGSVIQNGKINLHVWITLDSGEIIDAMGAIGIGIHLKIDEDPELEKESLFLIKHPFMGTVEDLNSLQHVQYFPMGIGIPFVKKIGLI